MHIISPTFAYEPHPIQHYPCKYASKKKEYKQISQSILFCSPQNKNFTSFYTRSFQRGPTMATPGGNDAPSKIEGRDAALVLCWILRYGSLMSWNIMLKIGDYYMELLLDLVGRYVPLIKGLMIKSRKGLLISIISRILFIPAFNFTTKYGGHGWMLMLTSLLGLSNGYLTVCFMTATPKGYKGLEQNSLGNLLVLFLLGDIFAEVMLG
ncbi:equilibrative nucleotide transporter 3-like [Macadamia integrifolia]|uniref:equilibrative nucleotide transporter 3-like n=1 Tax=Macadamia integrifolia TaxID=60698 RepID=UPI001C52D410|nr:equilibrative nucleotide transporter 3-like [Macadamia integrifolia]